jgi:hypothetical protein
MQLGSSIDSFPCFTRLNPCVAHCSTDSIPWAHHSRKEGFLDYDGGFIRLQIHMNCYTIIYRQQTSHQTVPPTLSSSRGALHSRARRAAKVKAELLVVPMPGTSSQLFPVERILGVQPRSSPLWLSHWRSSACSRIEPPLCGRCSTPTNPVASARPCALARTRAHPRAHKRAA